MKLFKVATIYSTNIVLRQSFRHLFTRRLVYSDFGDPAKVLRVEDNVDIGDGKDQLVIKMLASPVNPADINTIQGNYPAKPKTFPAVGGLEGVGVVASLGTGPNPQGLSLGDLVIPKNSGSGTWRSRIITVNADYLPIPKIDIVSAATLSVNPCTAYRLLKDFCDLQPGDTVIQNGGNSGVGRAVIQLCREFSLKSISTVRSRLDIEDLKEELTSLGNSDTVIITEEELRTGVKSIRTQLALNCVGGKVATDMIRTLEPGCVMVTYGGMSRQPVIAPTSHFIFNGIALQGFWMTRWNLSNPLADRLSMLNYLAGLCSQGKFKPPRHTLVDIDHFREVFRDNTTGFTNSKVIFKFD